MSFVDGGGGGVGHQHQQSLPVKLYVLWMLEWHVFSCTAPAQLELVWGRIEEILCSIQL